MKLYQLLIAVSLALLLAGCGTAKFSNRIAPTLACDKVLVVSWWQWFGISTEADERDASVILAKCKAP